MTFSGLFVPLITPFTADGAIALTALRTLAHELLDAGATGLVALGTTGEPSALSPPERAAVRSVVEQVSRDRRTPWIAGVHDGVVPATADAAMHAVPAFVRPGEDGVIAHFTALAAASPIPVVVYHVPYRTAQPLSADALLRLATLPNIAAMKYAPGTLDAATVAFLAAAADLPDFTVLAGDDVLAAPLLALGTKGAIMAAAHLSTADYAALVAAWHPGDPADVAQRSPYAKLAEPEPEPELGPGRRPTDTDGLSTAGVLSRARSWSHRLAPQSAALFAAPNPTVIKALLHAEGRIPSAATRLPLIPPAPEVIARAMDCRAVLC
jgi:4-hydroxy-tetrahydrodipicolinate synthase